MDSKEASKDCDCSKEGAESDDKKRARGVPEFTSKLAEALKESIRSQNEALALLTGLDTDLPGSNKKTNVSEAPRFTTFLNLKAESPAVNFGRKEQGKKYRCRTDDSADKRKANGGLRIMVDSTDGVIPLWAPNQALRWGFDLPSFEQTFQDSKGVMEFVRKAIESALTSWDFLPIQFIYQETNTDFRVKMISQKDCDSSGCVLASAFFPDSNRNTVYLYPTLFEEPNLSDIVQTLEHEIGHIFGLRHYFAATLERENPAELFGKDSERSIMNYGTLSVMTDDDRKDLKNLYNLAWNGQLTKIGSAEIHFIFPFRSPDLLKAVKEARKDGPIASSAFAQKVDEQ